MLGEIFGRKAGLTSAELTLFLFLELRATLESTLFPLVMPNPGLVGDETALSIGLGLPESAAPAEGVLKGPSFGVFRAVIRGVGSSSSCRTAVSMRDSGVLSNEASGSVRSSSAGKPSGGTLN